MLGGVFDFGMLLVAVMGGGVQALFIMHDKCNPPDMHVRHAKDAESHHTLLASLACLQVPLIHLASCLTLL